MRALLSLLLLTTLLTPTAEAAGRARRRAPASAGRAQPLPFDLAAAPFAATPADDQDGDCMSDDAEHAAAKAFRPVFVFDSRENARRANEPVTLYQVSTGQTRARGCNPPEVITVRYAYLFADDGGYVESAVCGDAHPGDNQGVRVEITVSPVKDGATRFALKAVHNAHYIWPRDPMFLQGERHPLIYLSAGKHHAFFDSRSDGLSSEYSDFGCIEGNDGRGPRLLAVVESKGAPARWHNVGELAAHPPTRFVGDLGPFGFPRDHAWSERAFCGGYAAGCDGTGSMAGMWLR